MKKPTDSIQISDDLSIPIGSLLSRKISGMGTNGSGKTYAFMKIVETVLRKNGWTIILDPVGIWYGLRLDRTGKKPSDIQIPIFGGEHGDMPLPSEAGKVIADLLFDKRLSAILDMSEFTDSELNRFCADFAERFLARMRTRKSAVSLVMDECQIFIPQNPQKGEEKKLHHFSKLGQVGRNYGIGLMMISPRPQEVSKRILNMSQLMFAFQMSGAHERAAMRDWFKHAGYKEPLDEILPTLEVGKPFVSSPAWLKINRIIERVHPKTTFDSSATPEFDGEAVKTITLSPLDMDEIKEKMSAIVEQAKADDPKVLKGEIAKLKAQLAKPQPQAAPEIRYVDKLILTDAQIADLKGAAERIQAASDRWNEFITAVADRRDDLRNTAANILQAVQQAQGITAKHTAQEYKPYSKPKANPSTYPKTYAPAIQQNTNGRKLAGGELKTLIAVSQYPQGITKAHIAALIDYRSSSVKTFVTSLKSAGFVTADVGVVQITDHGMDTLGGDYEPLPTGESLREFWHNNLSGGEQIVFDRIISAYPSAVEKSSLSNAEHPNFTGYMASSVKTFVTNLKRKHLLDVPRAGYIIASENLYD